MVLTQPKKIHYQPNGTNIPLLYAACIDLTGTSLRRLNLRAVTRPWEYESIQPNKRTHCANILLKTQTGSAMCKYLTSIYYLNDNCLKFWKDSLPTPWCIFKLCSVVAHSFESPTRPCLHSKKYRLAMHPGKPFDKTHALMATNIVRRLDRMPFSTLLVTGFGELSVGGGQQLLPTPTIGDI